MTASTHTEAAKSVTAMSVAVAASLIIIKGVVWLQSGSVALLAALADSGLDLVAALITFFAVRYAATPPDVEHPFGHGKAEAFAALVQAGLVFASGALIGREGVVHLLHPEPVVGGGLAIGAMATSIVLTGLLIVAQTQVLKKTGSVAVSGDRAHYIADFASNILALMAIFIASTFHFAAADALGGLAVAALLIWGAIGVLREAASHLLDESLPPETVAAIATLAGDDPMIYGIHQLRTRVSGPVILIQMHAELDPELSLDAAHKIMIAAEYRILQKFPDADVLIHPDPRGKAEAHGGAFAEIHEDAALSTPS